LNKKFDIRNFLNGLIWNPNINPGEYIIKYVSRGAIGDAETVTGDKILTVYHRGFDVKSDFGKSKYIPFHRIIEIRKTDGTLIFRSPRHSS